MLLPAEVHFPVKQNPTLDKIALSLLLLLSHPTAQGQDMPGLTLPSGQWQETEQGGILTLPDGGKFESATVTGKHGNMNDVVTVPNGQKFLSETGKSGPHVPFVSRDGSLVAIERSPATKTGILHQ